MTNGGRARQHKSAPSPGLSVSLCGQAAVPAAASPGPPQTVRHCCETGRPEGGRVGGWVGGQKEVVRRSEIDGVSRLRKEWGLEGG